MGHTNLQNFLKCTTPRVRSQFLPKTSIRNLSDQWHLVDGKDTVEYFTLEDLWDCYDEWSAYGAGASLRLSDHETVVQYYTPFLSGIQIYTGKSVILRNAREDLYLESEIDSTSSDDCEEERLSRSSSNHSKRTWGSEDSGTDLDVDLKTKAWLGNLYFQYFDSSSPHLRLPLKDKINKLAEDYPGLNSLRSIDLAPASWMAVAWYPIYHIPAQRNSKELYSAFVTYHTLSSSFQESIPTERVKHACGAGFESREARTIEEEMGIISLRLFGLATYRMQRQVWINPESEDDRDIVFLLSAAASWLTQLDVHHPDFTFFVSRSM